MLDIADSGQEHSNRYANFDLVSGEHMIFLCYLFSVWGIKQFQVSSEKLVCQHEKSYNDFFLYNTIQKWKSIAEEYYKIWNFR
jgi:hypothetical protein